MLMEKLWVSPLQRTTTSCSSIHKAKTGFHFGQAINTPIIILVLVQHDHQELERTRVAGEKFWRYSSAKELAT